MSPNFMLLWHVTLLRIGRFFLPQYIDQMRNLLPLGEVLMEQPVTIEKAKEPSTCYSGSIHVSNSEAGTTTSIAGPILWCCHLYRCRAIAENPMAASYGGNGKSV